MGVYSFSMNEKTKDLNMSGIKADRRSGSAKFFDYKWLVQWSCLLSTVFLASSALNCLFSWLAYGYTWDLMGLFFSALLAGFVYFSAFKHNRVASLNGRIMIALGSVFVWAIFFPVILKIAGYK